MKQTHIVHLVAAVMVVTVVLGASQRTPAATFQITIENLSPNVLTPVPFITHDAGFDLFDAGAAASGDLELLAEDGMPTGVVASAIAATGTTVSDHAVASGAPIGPGGSAMVTLDTTAAHPWLSFASMLAFSNDAFIGAAASDGAIDLFPGGSPLSDVILIQPSEVWDAGTEINDELAANVPGLGAAVDAGTAEGGVIAASHPGIAGVGDVLLSRDWLGGPVARITIVPEPATACLLALGAVTALLRRRR